MKNERGRSARQSGQILAGVVMVILLLMVVVPAMVRWVQNEAKLSVKDQQSTGAFNLAEAAIERGVWALKASTGSWARARDGEVTAGYDFDVTYRDIPGGSYRIRFSTASGGRVQIDGEGRDALNKETRAIRALYANRALPGPMLTSGIMTYSGAFECHWGPVMAQNNITISGNAATEYFPRKFSKQVVQGTAGQPRDTNGLTAPNTDGVEWWSDYAVPALPTLDFATMRTSAAANGTLNYYNGWASSHTLTGYSTPLANHGSCCKAGSAAAHPAPHSDHFFDSNHHPLSKANLIWYWDGNLTLTGNNGNCHRMGLYGTLIIRGNLNIETGDCYAFTGPVPATAWMEYARIKTAQVDSATANQYPADNGYQQNRLTFSHGSETWTGGPPSADTDVGLRGFIYVGGNFTIVQNAKSDFAGVIWVNGNVTNQNSGERSLVFYDSTLDVPVLNVILTRDSWQEVSPSAVAWP